MRQRSAKTNKHLRTQPLFCSVPLPSSSQDEGRCQLQILPCSAWFPVAQTARRTHAFISTAAARQVRADQTREQEHVKWIPHFLLESFTSALELLHHKSQKSDNFSLFFVWYRTHSNNKLFLHCNKHCLLEIPTSETPHREALGWLHPAMGCFSAAGPGRLGG